MMDRPERHTGDVGDCYEVDEEAAEYAKSRVGHGDFIELEAGDVLMRKAHSGDCFSNYYVFRDGKRMEGEWAGYDGVGAFVGNAVDAATLPFKKVQLKNHTLGESIQLIQDGRVELDDDNISVLVRWLNQLRDLRDYAAAIDRARELRPD